VIGEWAPRQVVWRELLPTVRGELFTEQQAIDLFADVMKRRPRIQDVAQGLGDRGHEIAGRIEEYKAIRLAETRTPQKRKSPPEAGATPTPKPEPPPVARATVQCELLYLRAAFRAARKAKRIATVPDFDLLDVHNVRERFPEPREVQAVIRELPDSLKPVAAFLAITGMRVGEALKLRWKDVDATEGTITLRPTATKTKAWRTVPYGVHPALKAIVEERRRATAEWQMANGAIVEHVFWFEGRSADGKAAALPVQTYSKTWRRATERAGVPWMWVHDLRRFAIRRLVRSGNADTVAAKISGHRTMDTFRRYNVSDERDVREAMRRLAVAENAAQEAPEHASEA
jgi:integrase